MCNFRCTIPVTKWFMGTVRESTGFQPSNLNCWRVRLLTCLVFSSFRFKISLLSMQARFWVSLRIVWRSWLWSRACSDAERAGEHARFYSNRTASTAGGPSTQNNKKSDQVFGATKSTRTVALLRQVHVQTLLSPYRSKAGSNQRHQCMWGNQHPSHRRTNDEGQAALTISKLGYSGANLSLKFSHINVA